MTGGTQLETPRFTAYASSTVLCRLVNMAFLATVGSRAVNGVAAIHSEIIKEDIFPVRTGTLIFLGSDVDVRDDFCGHSWQTS